MFVVVFCFLIVGLSDEEFVMFCVYGKKGLFYEVMSLFLKGVLFEEE